jgi:uncharacterized tellurite resistance protein B-like protein
MSQARRVKLHAVLKLAFGLDYPTTSKLIDGAAIAEQSGIDLYYFTRQLNEVLSADGADQTGIPVKRRVRSLKDANNQDSLFAM